MFIRSTLALLGALLLTGPALADAPPRADASTAKPRASKRRVERHDAERTAAVKGTGQMQLDTVVVFGRPQRPQAVTETSAQRFRFAVGTARYSERDRRFLSRGEGW